MIEKIRLHGINPVLPTVYDDGLTYIEAIGKLQYKINECIDLINGLDLPTIRQDLLAMKQYVDGVASDLTSYVNTHIANLEIKVGKDLADTLELVDEKLNLQNIEIVTYVTNRLDSFAKDIKLIYYSPVSGKEKYLYDIDREILNSTQYFGISYEDYNSLELGYEEYNSAEISFVDYNRYADTFFIGMLRETNEFYYNLFDFTGYLISIKTNKLGMFNLNIIAQVEGNTQVYNTSIGNLTRPTSVLMHCYTKHRITDKTLASTLNLDENNITILGYVVNQSGNAYKVICWEEQGAFYIGIVWNSTGVPTGTTFSGSVDFTLRSVL